MATIREIENEVLTYLRTNLTDINSHRNGKNWIFIDLPRSDIRDYPRIAIVGENTIRKYTGLGEIKTFDTITLHIYILVAKRTKLEYDSSVKNAWECLDYVSEQTDTRMRAKAKTLTKGYALYPMTENTIENDDLIGRDLIYRIETTRTEEVIS